MIRQFARTLRSLNTAAGRQVARKLIGLGICTILSQGALLTLMVLTADALGPAGFGSFIFAVTLQTYLCLIGTAGAQPVVVRDVAANPDRVDAIASSFFAVTGVTSLLVAACVIAGVFFVPLSAEERDVVLLFAIANVAASVNLSPLFDAQRQQVKGAIAITLADLLSLTITAVLWKIGALTLRNVGIILACKWILGTLLQALLYHFTARRSVGSN